MIPPGELFHENIYVGCHVHHDVAVATAIWSLKVDETDQAKPRYLPRPSRGCLFGDLSFLIRDHRWSFPLSAPSWIQFWSVAIRPYCANRNQDACTLAEPNQFIRTDLPQFFPMSRFRICSCLTSSSDDYCSDELTVGLTKEMFTG